MKLLDNRWSGRKRLWHIRVHIHIHTHTFTLSHHIRLMCAGQLEPLYGPRVCERRRALLASETHRALQVWLNRVQHLAALGFSFGFTIPANSSLSNQTYEARVAHPRIAHPRVGLSRSPPFRHANSICIIPGSSFNAAPVCMDQCDIRVLTHVPPRLYCTLDIFCALEGHLVNFLLIHPESSIWLCLILIFS